MRREVASRGLAHWLMHNVSGSEPPTFDQLVGLYDAETRASNDGFLDMVSARDVEFVSPKLRELADGALIDAIVQDVRSARVPEHVTHRFGSVETPVGRMFWGIDKCLGLRALFRAALGGHAFQLQLWHPADVSASCQSAAHHPHP